MLNNNLSVHIVSGLTVVYLLVFSLFAQNRETTRSFGVGLGLASLEQSAAALRLEYGAGHAFGIKPHRLNLNYGFSTELVNAPVYLTAFHARITALKVLALFRLPALLSAEARGDISSNRGREWDGQVLLRSMLYRGKLYNLQMQNGLLVGYLMFGNSYGFISSYSHFAIMFRPGRGQQLQVGLIYKRSWYGPGNLFAHNFGWFADYRLSGKTIARARLRFERLSMDDALRPDTGFWINFTFGRFFNAHLALYLYSDVYLSLNEVLTLFPGRALNLIRRNRYGLKLLWHQTLKRAWFMSIAYRQRDIRSVNRLDSLFVWGGLTFYFE